MNVTWTRTAPQTYTATDADGKTLAIVQYYGPGVKWVTEVHPQGDASQARTLATSQPTLRQAKRLALAFAV